MASEVRHLVDRGAEYPTVRLTGVLDAESAGGVRTALLDVLAEQPEALLVEVGGLTLSAPEGAAVLRAVREETADWPGAHLALCDARGAAAWPGVGWPVWPSPRDAIAELGEPDPDHRLSLELDAVLGAARRARELITEACARWSCPELAGPACIVVTELVNNVVVHARTPMVVLLAAHGDGLSVAVRDHSSHVPTFTGGPVPPTAYGGRGMLLIDSVADRWGNLRLGDGKVVWALMSAGGDPDGRHQRAGQKATSMADPARG
ncbi:ATP-binding protein [Actinoplanes sp. URMC 104]|uniref:ATP-binding protein n=1 Tax=Actinoplanes sp. URMC 104 TaxID=3423409 RepID=UPI003F1C19B2